MAVLEIETFTLASGVNAADFRARDEQMQEWCYLNRPGLARRTTARGDNNTYVVITLFGDVSQADPNYLDTEHPTVTAWKEAIVPSSRTVAVYTLL